MSSQVYIGLGSNLQQPVEQMRRAVQGLEGLPGTHIQRCSSLYQSKPLGPADQPDYLNAVVRMETDLQPYPLLSALQQIERAQGRQRNVHWGARTIDLDILLYDDLVMTDPALSIPHPGVTQRLFVLLPLFEIAPKLRLPNGERIASLVSSCAGSTPMKLSDLPFSRGETAK